MSAQPAPVNPSANEAATPPRGRILVVEDNRVNQELATAMLEKLQLEFVIANDGREAIDLVNESHFDMVLMDCQMPLMDGFEAATFIRRLPGGRTGRLPILALTDNPSPSIGQQCRAAGMDDFLAKPYTFEQLRERLTHWLSGSPNTAPNTAPTAPLTAPRVAPEYAPSALPPSQQPVAAVQASALGERPADGRVAPAVLNPTALQVLRELDPDGGMGLAKSVMRAFLDGSTKSLQQIDEGLRFADARSLARGAHTLKSSSANAGAHTLSELYGQLERLGREERIEEARALLPQVRLEHEQALAAMHRILHDGA